MKKALNLLVIIVICVLSLSSCGLITGGRDVIDVDFSQYSQGLEYSWLPGGNAAVKGIGSCTDTDIKIPPFTRDGWKVIIISKSAFEGNTDITSVTIPNSVGSIMDNAFFGCTSLKTVKMEKGIQSIGQFAFSNCTSLVDVTVPSDTLVVGPSVFSNCTSLVSATLSENITLIGTGMFAGCTSLTDVHLSNTMTRIPSNMFEGCVSLVTLNVPDSVESIGIMSFYQCTNLKNVNFGKDSRLATISQYAFMECTGLEELYLPASLTKIEESAFITADNIKRIIFAENSQLSVVGEDAFGGFTRELVYVKGSQWTDAFITLVLLEKLYYTGTYEEWQTENIPPALQKVIGRCQLYFYSAEVSTDPRTWYYDNGEPTLWINPAENE